MSELKHPSRRTVVIGLVSGALVVGALAAISSGDRSPAAAVGQPQQDLTQNSRG